MSIEIEDLIESSLFDTKQSIQRQLKVRHISLTDAEIEDCLRWFCSGALVLSDQRQRFLLKAANPLSGYRDSFFVEAARLTPPDQLEFLPPSGNYGNDTNRQGNT